MKAYIEALSYYLPEKLLSNEQLVEIFPDWTESKVEKKIGVKNRHIAGETETASDMAVKAAEKLFRESEIKPADIDFIIFCTQSPDYHLPTTACIIQSRLGIPTHSGAIDFNLGCSGYIYGLALAKGLVVSGAAAHVLLLTGETYSKYIHKKDRGNMSIFGDAASATVISRVGFAEIGDFSFGTDGKGADNLIVRTGCARYPDSQSTIEKDETGAIKSPNNLYMNGGEIFNFTLENVPALVEEVLNINNIKIDEIDYVIFHQANKFILETLRKICGFKKEKYCISMEETGNTVSSTIPIALYDSIEADTVKSGMNVMIAGFGVGLSWGGTILKFI